MMLVLQAVFKSVKACEQPDLLQERFGVDCKTRNIAIQLVLQQ